MLAKHAEQAKSFRFYQLRLLLVTCRCGINVWEVGMLTERDAALCIGDLASYVPARHVRQTSLVQKLHPEVHTAQPCAFCHTVICCRICWSQCVLGKAIISAVIDV